MQDALLVFANSMEVDADRTGAGYWSLADRHRLGTATAIYLVNGLVHGCLRELLSPPSARERESVTLPRGETQGL